MRRGRDGRHDVRRTSRGRVDGDVREPVALEELERVGALVLLEPRPMPELYEGDERIDEITDARQLRLRLGRLDEARVVLEEDPLQLSGKLERLERGAEVTERDFLVRLLVPRHRRVAFTWKMNSGGVRCAQRPVTSGSGRW